jgi:hypothetical protein
MAAAHQTTQSVHFGAGALVQLLLYYGVLQPIRNNDLRSSLLFLLNFESPFGFAWALIAKINAVTRRCRDRSRHFLDDISSSGPDLSAS